MEVPIKKSTVKLSFRKAETARQYNKWKEGHKAVRKKPGGEEKRREGMKESKVCRRERAVQDRIDYTIARYCYLYGEQRTNTALLGGKDDL